MGSEIVREGEDVLKVKGPGLKPVTATWRNKASMGKA